MDIEPWPLCGGCGRGPRLCLRSVARRPHAVAAPGGVRGGRCERCSRGGGFAARARRGRSRRCRLTRGCSASASCASNVLPRGTARGGRMRRERLGLEAEEAGAGERMRAEAEASCQSRRSRRPYPCVSVSVSQIPFSVFLYIVSCVSSRGGPGARGGARSGGRGPVAAVAPCAVPREGRFYFPRDRPGLFCVFLFCALCPVGPTSDLTLAIFLASSFSVHSHSVHSISCVRRALISL